MTAANQNLPDWVHTGLERQLLAHADVLQWMLEAAQQTLPVEQFLQSRIAGHPYQSELQSLIFQSLSSTDPQHESSPSGAVPTKPKPGNDDQDATFVGGRSTGSNPSSRPTHRETSGGTRPGTQAANSRDAQRSGGMDSRLSQSSGSDVHWRIRTRNLASGYQRYQIRQEIGRGGCGVVSTAFDTQLQRLVVVKQIIADSTSDEAATRFLNEAQITGQLSHPGIVPVYEMGQDRDGMPFYVMKFLDGQTLSQAIADYRNLPSNATKRSELFRLLGRFLDVCQTLAYAHDYGIIHRDLKPANVMIGQFGETVVLDWGLARKANDTLSKPSSVQDQTLTVAAANRAKLKQAAQEAKQDAGCEENSLSQGDSLTQQGAVLGTAAYMSPEQARGANSSLDQRSDVFSLGVMLYEVLSGVSPFRGDTLDNTIENVSRCVYTPLRQVARSVPKPLAAICSKAMQAQPDLRYQNANQLAEDLEAYLAGQPVSACPETWFDRFDRIANRHRAVFRSVFAATILMALAASIATGIVSRAHQSEQSARQQAVLAKRKTEEALAQEKVAAEFANQQLTRSREAADQWLIQLSGDLQFYPGLQPLRIDLLQRGQEHYERLASEVSAELERAKASDQRWLDDRQLELGRNQIRLGDLQRLMGDTIAAREHFQKATTQLQEIRQRVSADHPQSIEIQYEWVNAHLGLAMTVEDSEKALNLIQNVQRPLQELLNQNGSNAKLRNALVRSRMIHGRLLSDSDSALAIEKYQQGLADVDPLIQLRDVAANRRLKENLLRDLAQLYLQENQLRNAEAGFQNLLRHFETLPQADLRRPDVLESISWTRSYLANVQQRLGRRREALTLYQRATDDLDTAWQQIYSEPFYRENQAVLDFNRARILLDAGQREQAEQSTRDAMEQLRQVIQSAGPTVDRIHEMSRIYLLLTEILLPTDPEQATQWDQQTQVLVDHLAENAPDMAKALRVQSRLLFTEQQLLQRQPLDLSSLRTIPDHEKIQLPPSVQLRLARVLLHDPLRSGNSEPQYLDFAERYLTEVPAMESADQGAMILRSLLEVDGDLGAIGDRMLHFSEQLVREFPDSENAWLARCLTGKRLQQEDVALVAWDRFKWCRLETRPFHEYLQHWLSKDQDVGRNVDWTSDDSIWRLAVEQTRNAENTIATE